MKFLDAARAVVRTRQRPDAQEHKDALRALADEIRKLGHEQDEQLGLDTDCSDNVDEP
jgi:hypothetical protein